MGPLELYLVTFNCARNLIDPKAFGHTLFDALPSRQLPDILAISLQEVAPIGYAFLGGSYITNYLDRVRLSVKVATSRYAAENGSPEERLELLAVRTVG